MRKRQQKKEKRRAKGPKETIAPVSFPHQKEPTITLCINAVAGPKGPKNGETSLQELFW